MIIQNGIPATSNFLTYDQDINSESITEEALQVVIDSFINHTPLILHSSKQVKLATSLVRDTDAGTITVIFGSHEYWNKFVITIADRTVFESNQDGDVTEVIHNGTITVLPMEYSSGGTVDVGTIYVYNNETPEGEYFVNREIQLNVTYPCTIRIVTGPSTSLEGVLIKIDGSEEDRIEKVPIQTTLLEYTFSDTGHNADHAIEFVIDSNNSTPDSP